MKMMKKIFTLSLVLNCWFLQAQQMGLQTLGQLKESPAGSKIVEYFAVVNGNDEVPEGWVQKLFAPKLIEAMSEERLKGLIGETQDMEGQIHLYDAKRTSMFKYKLIVKGVKSNAWLSMVFTFEEQDPYRILGITMDDTDAEPANSEPIYPSK